MMGITRFIFNKIMGWSIKGQFDPKVKKAVVIVVPHTSWHDFYIGAMVRRIVQVDINFIGKEELFKPPFGWYFKWMGGEPLDRTPGQNKVSAIAKIFHQKEEFRLALAPEGTRKKVLEWKTGFYYIAVEAKVPIICVSFDYKRKQVTINPPVYSSGNYAEDFQIFNAFFKGVLGKKKENSWI